MSEQEFYILFSRNLNYYLSINQKTQADICRELKLSKATVSSWCGGKRVPRMDKIDMLCEYFGIKRSDLMEDRAGTPPESYYMNEGAREMAQFMYENPEYKVLFDASRKIKKEDIEFVKRMLDKFKDSAKS